MISTAYTLFLLGFIGIFWAQGMPLSFEKLEAIDYRLVYVFGIIISIVGFFLILREYIKENRINYPQNTELTDLRPVVISVLAMYNSICIPSVIPNEMIDKFELTGLFSRNFVDVLKDFFFTFENISYFSVWMPLIVFISSIILFISFFYSSKHSYKILSISSAIIILVAIIAYKKTSAADDPTIYLYNMGMGFYIAFIISVVAIITAFTKPKSWAYGIKKT